MIIAAAISGGWLAFIIGVVIAVILVALVSRFAAGRGRRPVRA
jgi:high-affinity nickel permease